MSSRRLGRAAQSGTPRRRLRADSPPLVRQPVADPMRSVHSQGGLAAPAVPSMAEMTTAVAPVVFVARGFMAGRGGYCSKRDSAAKTLTEVFFVSRENLPLDFLV